MRLPIAFSAQPQTVDGALDRFAGCWLRPGHFIDDAQPPEELQGPRGRITDTLVQARLQPSLAGLVGAAVRITLSVVAAFAALTPLGLEL
jgi:hypothetical protein